MSQQTVLQLMQELGGIATSSQIIRLASQKYPDLSLSHYVSSNDCSRTAWTKNLIVMNNCVSI